MTHRAVRLWAPALTRFASATASLALLASAGLVAGSAATSSASVDSADRGESGLGDEYYPLDGNGGIDVGHYDIHTRYDFDSGLLRGRTTLTLTPTRDLTRFNLDFLLPVSEVTVDGRRARHRTVQGHELVITPNRALRSGEPVRVKVRYAGRPSEERYAGESNWLADRHEVVTMNEPHMAPWWFPANDHPTDKASYDISVTVPRGLQVVANGELVQRQVAKKTVTWRWRAGEPMTSYLAFFAAGDFEIETGVQQTSGGERPWTIAVSRQLSRHDQTASMRSLRKTPEVVAWLESQLGPYPFSTTGGVVTSLSPGFALENQTRPVYPSLGGDSTWLLVHELAHQWFGDSVSVARWRDIWLNEGIATFMQIRYDEAVEGRDAQKWLTDYHASLGSGDWFWEIQVADPGRRNLFGWSVYERGGMTMQALRHRIGEDDFWLLLRTWLSTYRDANATSEQFEALAEQVSGEDLDGFFEAWLRAKGKPAKTADNGLI